MNITAAMELIHSLVYKPGWKFEATDHSNRFEGTIKVRVTYPAQNSDRAEAREGYPTDITTYAEFAIMVGDVLGADQVLRRLVCQLMKIEEHETREFLRYAGTFIAPFHPHTIDGMRTWQRSQSADLLMNDFVAGDLQFGVV